MEFGAIGERHFQHAGVGAEGCQRLLRAEDGEKIFRRLTLQGSAGLDLAVGIGEQRHASVERGALRQARRERALPIVLVGLHLVSQPERSEIGHQRQSIAREGKRGLFALVKPDGGAKACEQQKGRDQDRDEATEGRGRGHIGVKALAELMEWLPDRE